MKTFDQIFALAMAHEKDFLAFRKEALELESDFADDDVKFVLWLRLADILEYSLGVKNCRIIEDIHGGMDGIMESLMTVFKFDPNTSDFGPIIQMVMTFQEMIKDYKKGPKFCFQLGWHKTGEKREYTF